MPPFLLNRHHQRRLREVYRSAGWPSLDTPEIELLAAGLLERVCTAAGVETVRVTDAGIAELGRAHANSVAARSAHELLVTRTADWLSAAGRIAWRGLTLLADVQTALPASASVSESVDVQADAATVRVHSAPPASWTMACPDVYSIRRTSVAAYLHAAVHEIKVSRADLLGDLKKPAKRGAYLAMASECWYVLGQTAKGVPIAKASEVPDECGVLIWDGEALQIARIAPRRSMSTLPFHLWMALSAAAPCVRREADGQGAL